MYYYLTIAIIAMLSFLWALMVTHYYSPTTHSFLTDY